MTILVSKEVFSVTNLFLHVHFFELLIFGFLYWGWGFCLCFDLMGKAGNKVKYLRHTFPPSGEVLLVQGLMLQLLPEEAQT